MPTIEQFREIRAKFRSEADEDFFFYSLKSPKWIELLLQEGYFKKPPDPTQKGDYIQFPAWSQSRYLARMAKLAAEQVVDVVREMPATDNPQVLNDLFEVASAVPPEIAKRLLPVLRLPTKYRANHEGRRKYAAHLASGGFAAEALAVLQLEIGFQPDPKAAEKIERQCQQELRYELEPVTAVTEWDFNQIARDVIPSLVQTDPLLTIRILCKELDKGEGYSGWDAEVLGNDHSIFWRPAVSDHGQNSYPSTLSRYVAVIRDACEMTLRSHPDKFSQIDNILAGYTWTIFDRLRIHLVTEFPEAAGAKRLSEIANTKKFFDEPWWKREYVVFLEKHFAALNPEDQALILSWVDAGPSKQDVKHWRERNGDDENILKGRLAYWHIQHVQAFKDALSDIWKARYAGWLKDGGVEDVHLGFAFWVGDVESYNAAEDSPLTLKQLREMGVDSAIEYFKNWIPTGTFTGPNRSNLASVLEQLIKTEPAIYAESADRFSQLDPKYVSVVVRALAETFVAKTALEVKPTLRLLEALIREHGRTPDAADKDDGWDYTRLEVARFLEKVLPLQPSVFEPAQRRRIWGILSVLAADPNPSSENERLHSKSDFDAYSASLNRTRGTALHAVFDYADWVKRSGAAVPEFNFEHAVPEVSSLLKERLDTQREPTFMARTVFGKSFPTLFNLDPIYAQTLRPSIFPTQDDERYWAAWDTYVTAWRVGRDMLDALPSEYARAVERLGTAEVNRGTHWDPHQALGSQLLRLYWQGVLAWDHPLFHRFLEVAPAVVMAGILEEMGQALKNSEGAVSQAILDRLVRLWESRDAIWKQDEKRRDTESAAFYWWFASGKFEQSWATKEILATLDRIGTTTMDFMILERFFEQVSETPKEAMQAVRKMAMSAQETGRFFYADNRSRGILYAAGQSKVPGVRSEAEAVRDQLLALKYESFRDVLERPPGEKD